MDDTSSTGTPAASSPIIPAHVQAAYPEIITLIVQSESMNDEERQYWIDILPVMNADQVQKLRDILQNEHDQLAAIDAKYSKEISKMGEQQLMKEFSAQRKQQMQERSVAEQSDKEQERLAAEELLKKMKEL